MIIYKILKLSNSFSFYHLQDSILVRGM